MSGKVLAVYTGFIGHEGVPVQVRAGEEFDADHPLVAARPELFTDPPAPPKRPVLRGKAKTAEAPPPPPKGKDADS